MPRIEDKRVTYSSSTLRLWIERKNAIELIPAKSYKAGLNDTTIHCVKLAKLFSK